MRIGGVHHRSVWMEGDELCMIDQSQLPYRFAIARTRDFREVARAISTMVVRGAPAIGAAAAFALALAERAGRGSVEEAARVLAATRPTAQDLFAAVRRMLDAAASGRPLAAEAQAVADGYVSACEAIGEAGCSLVQEGVRILTHCNAGWLATVDWGTATAPMYKAHRLGRRFSVLVDETRPRCQGSRLTAFELAEEGVEHTIVADTAAGWFMSRKEVDLVIVGADRIAANGDVANKIGTYSLAVVARENGIPFYVAAPTATIDASCPDGGAVPIEERDGSEVSSAVGVDAAGRVATVRIAPAASPVRNPAFDITPARYVTAFITERGIFEPRAILQALEPPSGGD